MMKYTRKISLLIATLSILWPAFVFAASLNETDDVSLNGEWQMGFSRNYTETVQVPGIANDPTRIVDEVLWYKKEVKLPAGDWKKATLLLKGARFQPQVYVNGKLVGKQNGGMTRLYFLLDHKAVQPGKTITLEIALASLANVSPTGCFTYSGN